MESPWAIALLLSALLAAALLWARLRISRLQRMLHELHSAYASCQQSQKQSQLRLHHATAILRHLPLGVVQVDQHGAVVWLNTTAERWLAIDAAKHASQPLALFLPHPDDWHALAAMPYKSLTLQLIVQHEPRVVRATYWPLEAGGFVWLEDQTERERVAAMRRDFVANVSHELRTPLTLLIGALETLTDPTFELSPEKRQQLLTRSEAEAKRMLRLVSDLLQLAELEGNKPPEKRWLILDDLLDEAIETAVSLAPADIEIEREMSDLNEQGQLLADPDEISSALRNLVSNAVRYTPAPGRITIGAQKLPDGQIALFVRDTGIGIAPEHLPRLTERFYRVDRARSRATGGTGLGLAIVQHIADRHGAKLTIQSELGRGSTFSLIFPATSYKPATNAPNLSMV